MSTSTANAPINHISPSLSPSMTASNAQMSSSEIVQPIDSSSIDSTDTVAATTTMRATVHIANNANASPALSQSIDYREEFPTFQEIYHRTNNSTRITFGERVRRVISLLACVSPLARTRRSNRNRWQRTVKVKRKRSIQKHLIIKEVKKNGALAETQSHDASSLALEKRFQDSIDSKSNHLSHIHYSDESSVTDGDDVLSSPEPSSRDVDMNMHEPEKDSSSDCVQLMSVSCQVDKTANDTKEPSLRMIDCSNECPICLSNFKVGEKVCWSRSNSCSHGFHLDCMLAWLQNHPNCPLCRRRYLIPTEDEEDQPRSTIRGVPVSRLLRQRRSDS